jgi:hypothetical protein
MAFMLACGGLVNNPESSSQLLDVAKEYVAQYSFHAFSIDVNVNYKFRIQSFICIHGRRTHSLSFVFSPRRHGTSSLCRRLRRHFLYRKTSSFCPSRRQTHGYRTRPTTGKHQQHREREVRVG